MAKKRVAKRNVTLPRKMSSLIKIALADMRKAEAKPDYFVVDMGVYFKPTNIVCCTDSDFGWEEIIINEHPACVVCAAGSVMAFTLGKKDSKEELVPEDMSGNDDQLMAIDSLRQGSVYEAAHVLELPEGDSDKYRKFDCVIPEYDRKNPKPFHKAMEKLQKKLERAGL